MRRLFSTFAHGPPAIGLLLMRLAAGTALIVEGYLAMPSRPALGAVLLQGGSMGLGILLLMGLWTPLVGALVAVEALWNVFAVDHPWRWSMIATLGAALALIGPGAWSLDAWLFGWKRLEIRSRKDKVPPP